MAIVITGVGVKSPLGCSFEECMKTLEAGTRCVSEIENFDTTGFTQKAAGEVRLNGRVIKTPKEIDRKAYFLNKCVQDLKERTRATERFSPAEIVFNTGGGVDYVDIDTYYRTRQFTLPAGSKLSSHYKSKALTEEIALKNGFLGGVNIFMASCAASSQAIGTSFRMVRSGFRKAAVTGGSDSMINYINYIGFQQLGAMSSCTNAPYACKPFDRRRDGTVLGEGSIVYFIEDSNTAIREEILAEIVGYASTMDAYAVTDPDPEGRSLAEAISMAINDAGINPDIVDCVHLHGTGTPKNAPAEYSALKLVFGERAGTIPVYSMKGQIGHLIGSCGAMEILGAIYSLQKQVVLPTINFEEQDPSAPLNVIRNYPLNMKIEYLLKTNSSFGGENTAIILKRYNLGNG